MVCYCRAQQSPGTRSQWRLEIVSWCLGYTAAVVGLLPCGPPAGAWTSIGPAGKWGHGLLERDTCSYLQTGTLWWTVLWWAWLALTSDIIIFPGWQLGLISCPFLTAAEWMGNALYQSHLISVHQWVPPVSAAYQCLSVLPVSAHKYILSVPLFFFTFRSYFASIQAWAVLVAWHPRHSVLGAGQLI